MSTTSNDADAVAELREAHEELQRLRSAYDAADTEEVDAVADAYESVEVVLDRWEERATDWDDFEGYVEFRNDISATLESIPEDIPESEAFLEADSHVKTSGVSGSLKASDFEAAREALAPAREYAEKRQRLRNARERYREAYRNARKRRSECADRIDELERLVRLGEADLEAPIERLKNPITAYNEAVRADFETFRRDVSAREFLTTIARAADRPFVAYETPPAELLEYVRENDAGDHTVPELLEYAEYSPSKLSHYVDDANLLKRRVATNRTYLERLSADPLCIEWPPADAERLRFRIDELVSVLGRFADEETVAALREIRELTRLDDYGRLRDAAAARSGLTDDERKRIESGAVESELAALREERQQLAEALEEYDV